MKKQGTRKQELEKTWKSIEETIVDENGDKKVNISNLTSEIKEGTEYKHLKKAQKAYVLSKLEKLAISEEKEQKNKEALISEKWEAIVRTVEREASKTGKSELEVWNAVNQSILRKENNISLPNSIRREVTDLIKEQVKGDGEDYLEAVKDYTQDFEFLTGFRGLTFATHGHRKFSKPEYSRMFNRLIVKIKESENPEYPETEERLLKKVLSRNAITDYYERKIIEERLARIKRDKIKNRRRIFER